MIEQGNKGPDNRTDRGETGETGPGGYLDHDSQQFNVQVYFISQPMAPIIQCTGIIGLTI